MSLGNLSEEKKLGEKKRIFNQSRTRKEKLEYLASHYDPFSEVSLEIKILLQEFDLDPEQRPDLDPYSITKKILTFLDEFNSLDENE